MRGRALATGGLEAVLTPEITGAAARAFLDYAETDLGVKVKRLSVGHDSRLTAQNLKAGILSALNTRPITVLDCGLMTTPAMFMTTKFPETDCDAAIMITASHMPFDMNGLKFFTRSGGLEGKDIAKILDNAQRIGECGVLTAAPHSKLHTPNLIKVDGLKYYKNFLKNKFITETGSKKPFAGRKIAVDAGNGAGGFYARVLKELGADVSNSQYLEPDGNFPNHIPNPEDAEAMRAARGMMKKSGAEAGVIFDADADRAGLLGRNGDINRSTLIALCAKLLAKEQPGCTVVTDSVTNRSLTPYMEALGVKHHRFKRGYKNVIDEAVRLRSTGVNAVLAIETSGHAAFYDNSFLDDGAYLASYILIRAAKLGKSLDELTADFTPPLEEKEIRLPIKEPDFRAAGEAVLKRIEAEARVRNWEFVSGFEGVRFISPDACLTARLSLHEPLLVLNYESDAAGGCSVMHGIIEQLTIYS